VARLVEILKTTRFAMDTSPTGSGKTFAALGVASAPGLAFTNLVICCPATLKDQWAAAVCAWTCKKIAHNTCYGGWRTGDGTYPGASVVIVSYDELGGTQDRTPGEYAKGLMNTSKLEEKVGSTTISNVPVLYNVVAAQLESGTYPTLFVFDEFHKFRRRSTRRHVAVRALLAPLRKAHDLSLPHKALFMSATPFATAAHILAFRGLLAEAGTADFEWGLPEDVVTRYPVHAFKLARKHIADGMPPPALQSGATLRAYRLIASDRDTDVADIMRHGRKVRDGLAYLEIFKVPLFVALAKQALAVPNVKVVIALRYYASMNNVISELQKAGYACSVFSGAVKENIRANALACFQREATCDRQVIAAKATAAPAAKASSAKPKLLRAGDVPEAYSAIERTMGYFYSDSPGLQSQVANAGTVAQKLDSLAQFYTASKIPNDGVRMVQIRKWQVDVAAAAKANPSPQKKARTEAAGQCTTVAAQEAGARVLVCNIAMADAGLNFDDNTKGGAQPRVVFASPSASILVMKQFLGRFLRANTTSSSEVNFVYAAKQEEAILTRLQKQEVVLLRALGEQYEPIVAPRARLVVGEEFWGQAQGPEHCTPSVKAFREGIRKAKSFDGDGIGSDDEEGDGDEDVPAAAASSSSGDDGEGVFGTTIAEDDLPGGADAASDDEEDDEVYLERPVVRMRDTAASVSRGTPEVVTIPRGTIIVVGTSTFTTGGIGAWRRSWGHRRA